MLIHLSVLKVETLKPQNGGIWFFDVLDVEDLPVSLWQAAAFAVGYNGRTRLKPARQGRWVYAYKLQPQEGWKIVTQTPVSGFAAPVQWVETRPNNHGTPRRLLVDLVAQDRIYPSFEMLQQVEIQRMFRL